MEPVGCVYCLPFNYWNSSGGNRGPSLPNQPNHHPGDESVEDCQGAQAAEDGQGDPSLARHSHAGFATGLFRTESY